MRKFSDTKLEKVLPANVSHMKKRILFTAAPIAMLLGIFLLGPTIGKSIYASLTPKTDIQAWKTEFGILDGTFPRTVSNETRRLEVCRKLAQRGINIDDGIRDEAIEHNINPYTIFVMTCWRWEELLGL